MLSNGHGSVRLRHQNYLAKLRRRPPPDWGSERGAGHWSYTLVASQKMI